MMQVSHRTTEYNEAHNLAIERVFLCGRGPHLTSNLSRLTLGIKCRSKLRNPRPPTYGAMHAFDPTHPLYPIACFLSVIMLSLVLLTNFVRQRWNFGVASLCFWLLLELLFLAINSIIWSDNADIKLYVYCDIGESDYVCAAITRRA